MTGRCLEYVAETRANCSLVGLSAANDAMSGWSKPRAVPTVRVAVVVDRMLFVAVKPVCAWLVISPHIVKMELTPQPDP
jgi:hypothetical protein